LLVFGDDNATAQPISLITRGRYNDWGRNDRASQRAPSDGVRRLKIGGRGGFYRHAQRHWRDHHRRGWVRGHDGWDGHHAGDGGIASVPTGRP